jgi:nicotinate-nucleotide pyrophosphorylase
MPLAPLPSILIEPIVRAALLEDDLGRAGDITTDAIVPSHARAKVSLAARQAGVVAGLDLALMAFRLIDPAIDTLEQLAEALRFDIDAVLLDNMDHEELGQAVAIVDGRAITEASGGITPATAGAVATTGVDLLSMGWLTQSVRALDIGLDHIA